MAMVVDAGRGRNYLPPDPRHAELASVAAPAWFPDEEIAFNPRDIKAPTYGLTRFGDLFTPRQLVALTAFSDLVEQARERVLHDAIDQNDRDASEYAAAIATYLAFAVDRSSNTLTTIARWTPAREQTVTAFARQAIPMTWDFVELSPFSKVGPWLSTMESAAEAMRSLAQSGEGGEAEPADAATHRVGSRIVISTDPPYYDNIGYADLSDFFYVWLRRSLRDVYPDLFATLAVPKDEELVATPYRHGGKDKAEAFFLDGMMQAMRNLAVGSHPAFPLTIFYAFKQSETNSESGTSSTGWATFLEAVGRAGLGVSGTWPIRTERGARSIGLGANALASSIVLVCRARAASGEPASRREFLAALKAEVPVALAHLQRGNIAPVDLTQAAIGPGMAVFTRFQRVLDAEGTPLTVQGALALINQVLGEVLAEQEGDFDADSRFAIAWFDQYGFGEGEYGVADVLARAKNTSVSGMVDAGILKSGQGKVRLLRPDELDPAWDPSSDRRRPAWQAVHQLVRAAERGEEALAELIGKLGPEADIARELAYRLYVLCDRKKRTTEAGWYNGLVQSWPEAMRLATSAPADRPVQGQLFGEG